MNNLTREFQAEKEHISKTLTALKDTLDRKPLTIVELAALSTFIHNIYNGIENLLKRILKFKGINIPTSVSWHKDILDLSVDNKIITLEHSNKLDEYRAFRHFFIHGYGVILDKNKLTPLANNIFNVWKEFELQIQSHIENSNTQNKKSE